MRELEAAGGRSSLAVDDLENNPGGVPAELVGHAARMGIRSHDMTTQPDLTRRKRPRHRRDLILAAAIKLFHERGYHATAMDEIGAAVGITGPAVYRHFRNKLDILETALLQRREKFIVDVSRIVLESSSQTELLQQLVSHWVDALLEDPALTAVSIRERRVLSADARAVAERVERLHLEEWVNALVQLRPELSDGEARTMVRGTTGVAAAALQYDSGLDEAQLGDILRRMIMGALLA